ncbi:MAG TPA: hypothetical protein PLB18_12115 [Acidobacteriota bacterium]|nr:hypothetical protein [Acidobacteriota bacterium]
MWLALVFGLIGWFFPNQSEPVVSQSGEPVSQVQLLDERIDVTIYPWSLHTPRLYHAWAICKVHNPSSKPVRLPVTSVIFGRRGQYTVPVTSVKYIEDYQKARAKARALAAQTDWFHVRQDGRSLAVTRDFSIQDELHKLYSFELSAADRNRYNRWLAEWEATIPGLRARKLAFQRLAADYKPHTFYFFRKNSRASTVSLTTRAADTLETTVKPYLIEDDVAQEFSSFLISPDPRGAILRIISEIDPTLRIDEKQGTRKYISILDPYHPERYQAYFPRWSTQIRDWIAARPDVAKATKQVIAHHNKYLKYNAAREALIAYVQNTAGLSQSLAEQYVAIDKNESESWRLDQVLRQIRPEIEAELNAKYHRLQTRSDQLRGQIGGGRVLCSLTGDLYDPEANRFLAIGGLAQFPENRHPLQVQPARLGGLAGGLGDFKDIEPKVLTYQIELAPFQTSVLSTEYILELSDGSQTELFSGQFAYQLKTPTVWQRLGQIEFRVRIPNSLFPIFQPETVASMAEKDSTLFTIPVSTSDTHVYFNVLEKKNQFWKLEPNQENLERLRMALDRVHHPQVRLVLEAAMISLIARMEKPFTAWEQWLVLKKENPAHPAGYLSFKDENEIEELEESFEDMETFLKSPNIEIADNKGFLDDDLAADWREVFVPKLVARQKEKLTPVESLHLAVVLCHLGVEPEKNLAQVVALAGQSREMAREALAALDEIEVDKSAQLEFFVQFLQREPEKCDELAQELHQLASYNLPDMHHPSVAGRLIEVYLQTLESDVQHRILEAILSIKPVIPFEQLMRLQLSDEIGEMIWGQYVAALAESDPERARTVLRKWLLTRPKQKFLLLKQLALLGDPLIREPVIKELEVTRDDHARRELVSIIRAFGDPALLLQLQFNSRLEPWMETTLLDLIPHGASDPRLFNWVEAQFQNANLNRRRELLMPYLRAFQKLRDRRALPYLYSMLEIGQHQEDIAKVIGEIVLDEALPRNK